MGLPWRDGKGWRPDTRAELFADIILVGFVALSFGFVSGLDAQVEYVATAPGDYFLPMEGGENSVYFTEDSVDLMNSASKNSLGSNAIGAERLYCGELRNSVTRNFRLADVIDDSTLTSVVGSCIDPVDIWVHSQPDGNSDLSREDKDLESTGASYTCIQYSEIASSPITGKLNGVNCWDIVANGASFEPVNVYMR